MYECDTLTNAGIDSVITVIGFDHQNKIAYDPTGWYAHVYYVKELILDHPRFACIAKLASIAEDYPDMTVYETSENVFMDEFGYELVVVLCNNAERVNY